MSGCRTSMSFRNIEIPILIDTRLDFKKTVNVIHFYSTVIINSRRENGFHNAYNSIEFCVIPILGRLLLCNIACIKYKCVYTYENYHRIVL